MHSSTYRYPVQGSTRQYFCSPLTDAAHNAMNAWVRSVYYQRQSEMLESCSDPSSKDAIVRVCMNAVASMTWTEGVGLSIAATVEGALRLLYEGCRVLEPSLEYVSFKNDIVKRYTDEAELARISRETFQECNPAATQSPKAENVTQDQT